MPLKNEQDSSSSSTSSPCPSSSTTPNKTKIWTIKDDYEILLVLYAMTKPGNMNAQQRKAIAQNIGRTERAVQLHYNSAIRPVLEHLISGKSLKEEPAFLDTDL